MTRSTGAFLGAFVGAILGGLFGGAVGPPLGETVDANVLDHYQWLDCGHIFSVNPS